MLDRAAPPVAKPDTLPPPPAPPPRLNKEIQIALEGAVAIAVAQLVGSITLSAARMVEAIVVQELEKRMPNDESGREAVRVMRPAGCGYEPRASTSK